VGAAAPLLGQHTSETLSELLGIEPATLAALAARGVVFKTEDTAKPAE
jgi:crotonobetainyl-CoA:carnitine CoA-transferase CaiB-like acyl-CoA transferase